MNIIEQQKEIENEVRKSCKNTDLKFKILFYEKLEQIKKNIEQGKIKIGVKL